MMRRHALVGVLEWGFNQAFRYMLALPFCMAIVQACGHLLKLRSGDEA